VIGEEGATALGWMYTMAGVGSVAGPLIGGIITPQTVRALNRAVLVGFILVPFAWFLVGVAVPFEVVLIGFMLRGMAGSINWTYSTVLIQMQTPDNFLGRVVSFDFAIFTLMMALSVWLGGAAADVFGLDPRSLVLWIVGLSVLPVLFWGWTMRGAVGQAQASVQSSQVPGD
ncbi:MAG: MFS transporter, partial [Chloroflexi bacterium]|nr:MFS transporter [Chloroflexota bacterium]